MNGAYFLFSLLGLSLTFSPIWWFIGIMEILQWGTKLLGQLIWYAVIPPVFPHPPSNVVVCAGLYTLPCLKLVSSFQHCCSLCGAVHFTLSKTSFFIPTLFGGGRGGPFAISRWLEKCICCYIWIFEMYRMWKEVFTKPFQGFLSSIVGISVFQASLTAADVVQIIYEFHMFSVPD